MAERRAPQPETRVTLDAAGNAEAVLQRLIHERQSLQNAAHVMQTYREVLHHLEPAERQLAELRRERDELEQELSQMHERKAQLLREMEAEIAHMKDSKEQAIEADLQGLRTRQAEAEAALDLVRSRVAGLEAEEVEMTARFGALKERLERETQDMQATHAEVQQALERIHAAVRV